MNIFSTEKIKIEDFYFLFNNSSEISDIPTSTLQSVQKGFQFLFDYLNNNPEQPVYGINTGFGSLCQVAVAGNELEELQYNLLRSHACGCGEPVENELVKLMLALKIRALGFGYSGVHTDTLQRLHLFLKNNWLPVVYEYGSLGASGDLAPLAHLCLPLIGEGLFNIKGKVSPALDVYRSNQLLPVRLHPKEGLALLNGTQFMLAHLLWCCIKGKQLLQAANHVALLSGMAFDIKPDPFHPALHNIRPHPGQIETARFFHEILNRYPESKEPKKQVQDPYSFRCIPQVHGASSDAWNFAARVCETEINSVTDNPTLFPEEELVLSGGNFHGQPLALALDFLGLAMHELGNISERRIYLLLSGQRGLKPFLADNPGLQSGYMIMQYAAASLVSYNKTMTMPSSSDSIVSSNGQEDHVSMGANAGLKTKKIIENTFKILGMELLTAGRALKQKNKANFPSPLHNFFNAFQDVIPHYENDHIPQPYIERAAKFLEDYTF
jgi:histidine ammonia-lyase